MSRLSETIDKRKVRFEEYKSKGNPNVQKYWDKSIQPDIDVLDYLRDLSSRRLTTVEAISVFIENRKEELSNMTSHFPENELVAINKEEKTLYNLRKIPR